MRTHLFYTLGRLLGAPSCFYEAREIRPEPSTENMRANPEDPRTKLEQQARTMQQLVDGGEATNGQKEWLRSYSRDPRAPMQVHYFRLLQGNGETLTKGQAAFLGSYENDPRAPQGVHYCRQLIAEGETLNDSQRKLLKTYEESKMPTISPSLDNLKYL